jgi:hypothetical protein
VALAALVAVIATGIAIAIHVKRRFTAASTPSPDAPPANAVDAG